MSNHTLEVVEVVLISFSACLDNFTVGTVFGLNNRKFGWVHNLVIATLNTLGTLVTMVVGITVSNWITPQLTGILAGSVFVVLGGTSLYHSSNSETEFKKTDEGTKVNLSESLGLGLGLTLSNLVSGVAAGVAGLSISLSTLLALLFSFTALAVGNYLGLHLKHKLPLGGESTNIIASSILICFGLVKICYG